MNYLVLHSNVVIIYSQRSFSFFTNITYLAKDIFQTLTPVLLGRSSGKAGAKVENVLIQSK